MTLILSRGVTPLYQIQEIDHADYSVYYARRRFEFSQ